ncbi:uncharacterized protein Bfra_006328 [Botrytis fragariae]|uniref:Uncharacterized protein n=1 Tax=Botrytis fragariae TaxID=1964551 RepID=A0A8H6ENW8_9HELO|nr:uncharacterized protein Bfra_006328 [Botrytis fragariae]KAF5879123.1 hypothetical protein Bfra_006328 [Botrytis fragariae]
MEELIEVWKRVEITDSGRRAVKEKVTNVLKRVVLGDEATVDAATTDADLRELGTVAGAVIHASRKAEVPPDWGWEGRYYEMVKNSEDNWNDLLRLLYEFTPDIDVQAVANILDVDNHIVWEMPQNCFHYPGIMLDISTFKPPVWNEEDKSVFGNEHHILEKDPAYGFYFNRQVGVQDWGWSESKTEMPLTRPERCRMFWFRTTPIVPKWAIGCMKKLGWEEGGGLGAHIEGRLGYVKLLEATEEGEMVACHNPRDESHWEDYNFDASKPNHEEYHYYKLEMIFVSPKDLEEMLEMAAATLPGVFREPWNEFHIRKEQEGVRKNAEMEAFREFTKRGVLKDREYVCSKHARYMKRAAKQVA